MLPLKTEDPVVLLNVMEKSAQIIDWCKTSCEFKYALCPSLLESYLTNPKHNFLSYKIQNNKRSLTRLLWEPRGKYAWAHLCPVYEVLNGWYSSSSFQNLSGLGIFITDVWTSGKEYLSFPSELMVNFIGFKWVIYYQFNSKIQNSSSSFIFFKSLTSG